MITQIIICEDATDDRGSHQQMKLEFPGQGGSGIEKKICGVDFFSKAS